MKHYSNDTLRAHFNDLNNLLEAHNFFTYANIFYFLVNKSSGKIKYPIYDLAFTFPRDYPAIGVLDLHDISQEMYIALFSAWDKIDWKVIKNANNPHGRLWTYLKKSIKLDVRHRINESKDGIRIPRYKLWENSKINPDDFLTVLYPQLWFWENDEVLNIYEEPITSWDSEMLREGLDDVLKNTLSNTERLIIEMSFGIDQPKEKPRSVKYIASYFNLKEGNIRKIKQRAMTKLKTLQNKEYLQNFYEF